MLGAEGTVLVLVLGAEARGRNEEAAAARDRREEKALSTKELGSSVSARRIPPGRDGAFIEFANLHVIFHVSPPNR